MKKKKLRIYSWHFTPKGAFMYQSGKEYTMVPGNIKLKTLLQRLPFVEPKVIKDVKQDGIRFVEIKDKFCKRTVFIVGANTTLQAAEAGGKLGY